MQDTLTELYTSLQKELESFRTKGSKAAGTRARLLATELQKHLATMRKDILIARKNKI